MGKIVIQRNRPIKVLSGVVGSEVILTDETGTAFQVVTLEDGDLSLVKRGRRTITSATQTKTIMSEDSVSINVSSNSVLDIRINDWFEVDGEVYRINQAPGVKKLSETSYEYTIRGEGAMFDMLRVKLLSLDGKLDFPLIGTIDVHLSLIASNMARFSPLWTVAPTTAGETKTITYNGDSCLSAIQKICQEFDTEFWVSGNTIYTGSFGNTNPLTLQYGKGKGLYDLDRKTVNSDGIINRLYVEGGSENIPSDYRGFSDKLKFSADGYIEDAALISDIGLREGYIQFPDIYPSREGQVSTKAGTTVFTDSTLDFDINAQLIPGTTAKVHFNTGSLAGYSFEIKSYVHATKTLEIIPFDNGNGQIFPDSIFQFEVGDKYVLLDIIMPTAYIDAAEAELLIKGTEQFNLKKQSQVSYDLNLAEDFAKNLPTPIGIGDLVHVLDPALGIDKVIRVNQVTRNLIDYSYKIVIADTYEIALASKIQLELQKVKNVINVNKIDQLRLSRIGLQVTEELKESIYDPDGYFDPENIRPESIETGMLSVGSRSQAISTSLIFQTNVGGNVNAVAGNAFRVYSQSLEKEWTLPGFSQTIPDNNVRLVYAIVSKTGTTGTVLITSDKLGYDDEPNNYRIVLGMLSSVIEGARVFVPTYGMTTITGGLIRTGIISSTNGTTSFNLNTGNITGRITFTSGSSGYDNLTDKPDLSPYDDAYDYIYGDLQTTLTALQSQADGAIETWFMNGVPTLSNLPASDWATEALKEVHEGDLYFNKDTGLSYRFFKNGSVWAWEQVADQSSQFMTELSEMQEALDGKMKVFVNTPIAPYQIGDLWLKGGELWRATTAKTEGQTYNIADWVHAVNYTDDSALNTFIDITYFADKANLQSQIDGKIDTWFTNSDPSGEWTPTEKTAHTGDMWYNNTAKELKRWNGATWDLIQDQTALSAYQAASEAQDTADGKRTVFVAQPTTAQAYEVGDLWVNATVGTFVNEILRAQTAKASGATFNLGHWVKASKYTDDTRAEQIRTELQGTISDSEQAAKDYADDELAAQKTILEAYADDKVDAEEARAIADATAKADAAKNYADAQDLLLTTQLEAYADGAVSTEESSRIAQAQANLQAAKDYADAQADAARITAEAYADGVVDVEEARAIADANTKLATAKAYAEAQDSLLRTELQVYADGVVDAEEAARLAQAATNLQAAKDYAAAEDALKETSIKAYADGKIDAAEQRSITDATNKADAAKTYAVAQDNLLKTQLEAYTDGKIDAEEQARIDAALQAIEAAQDYTDKQAILSKIAFEAYADGKVDAEEAARIAEAERAMNEAKEYAESLLDGKKIGAKQLLREQDPALFNYSYWGGVGQGNVIDVDSINPVEAFAIGDENNKALVTEQNILIQWK